MNESDGCGIEVALPISESITVSPKCDVKTLEEMRVVSYIHKGPYQDVGVAHDTIHEYMARGAQGEVSTTPGSRDLY